jgi:hypothetical protein
VAVVSPTTLSVDSFVDQRATDSLSKLYWPVSMLHAVCSNKIQYLILDQILLLLSAFFVLP